jgi:ABC-type phosphate transport system substrate-binding protein
MTLRNNAMKGAIASLAAAGIFAAASDAHADVACNTLTGTPVVFTGSSASKPMLKQVSPQLSKLAAPVRLLYQSVGSCQGLSDITTSTKEPATAVYWDDTTGAETTCTLADVAGIVPDVGVSDVFPTSCANITVPAGQKDFTGSAQVFNFIVPPTSKENVISLEAAFVVFGWGGVTNTVAPWSDTANIFRRAPTSGTYTMLSKLIGLDISKLKGTCPDGAACKAKTGDIVSAVHNADATSPNAAIGIASSDFADANRGGAGAVKILAYQHKGAACGVYPDTSSSALDKYNVRHGYYPFWGPLHFVTAVDGTGAPANAAVKSALSYFTRQGLTDVAAKKAMIDYEVAAFTVPQCAMNVKRTSEVAPNDTGLTSYTPDEPCGCYYESKATNATPKSCTACTDDTPCGAGKCRYGFCEAK